MKEYTQEDLAKIGFEIIEARRKGGKTTLKKYGTDRFRFLQMQSVKKRLQNRRNVAQ